jgi:hypothetical protein
MKIFKSLGSLIGRAPTEELPTSVYAILINDVYSVLGAFAIGACTATLVGSIAAWRTHNGSVQSFSHIWFGLSGARHWLKR